LSEIYKRTIYMPVTSFTERN